MITLFCWRVCCSCRYLKELRSCAVLFLPSSILIMTVCLKLVSQSCVSLMCPCRQSCSVVLAASQLQRNIPVVSVSVSLSWQSHKGADRQFLLLTAAGCLDVGLNVGQSDHKLHVLFLYGGLQVLQFHPTGGQQVQHTLKVGVHMLSVEL